MFILIENKFSEYIMGVYIICHKTLLTYDINYSMMKTEFI